MRFHLPTFLHYLDVFVPLDILIEHHHYIVYLLSAFPLQPKYVRKIVTRAVIKTFESPLVTPSGPEERSPIKGLLDTHLGRLRRTLLGSPTYLRQVKILDARGTIVKYETHIDIIDIEELLRTIRLEDDVDHIWSIIRHDEFCSVRLTERKLLLNFGKAFSKRRITEALEQLEALGLIAKNGRIRTHGRDVLGAAPHD